MKSMLSLLVMAAALSSGSLLAGDADLVAEEPVRPGPADAIVDSLQDAQLRLLAADVLARNPRVAAMSAAARAADRRPAQLGSLPDPMASLTLFLLQPQTRVGPQQAAVAISQRLPWFGSLKLQEQAALLEAATAWTRVAAARLELVTQVRSLYLELQYLECERNIVAEDQTTLEHYEELAEARYASGVGIGQPVIKIQAEITTARARLLDIEERRSVLVAEINALRDQPQGTPVSLGALPPEVDAAPHFARLRELAMGIRPELAEAQARIEAAAVRVELAKKAYRPDVTVGLNYALVGRREDDAGRLNPPAGNGDDILGLSGGINLPVWRSRLAAGVEEAVQQRLAAEQSRRAIATKIGGELGELERRIPLIREQLELFEKILIAQAEESLQSAELAYASGTVGALDLLDAERFLIAVRISTARTRTDLAVAAARLEGATATPLSTLDGNGSAS